MVSEKDDPTWRLRLGTQSTLTTSDSSAARCGLYQLGKAPLLFWDSLLSYVSSNDSSTYLTGLRMKWLNMHKGPWQSLASSKHCRCRITEVWAENSQALDNNILQFGSKRKLFCYVLITLFTVQSKKKTTVSNSRSQHLFPHLVKAKRIAPLLIMWSFK